MSPLYENSHVVFHWTDGSQPDRQIYFGHISTIVGFLNDRYLVERNMLGVHVYDLEKDELAYDESDLNEEERTGLAIDFERFALVDENGKLCYKYSIKGDGGLQMSKVVE